jgi:hypothetical protein
MPKKASGSLAIKSKEKASISNPIPMRRARCLEIKPAAMGRFLFRGCKASSSASLMSLFM